MRILVVEDEPDLLSALAQALREEGYAVDTAMNGHDALIKACGNPYDALVLDLMLPKIDGFTVLKELRRRKITTPVLVLTARDDLPDRVRGLDSGADDYVTKPFELPELLARLRALVRRAARKSSPLIEIADVKIDLTARTVRRAAELVPLTAREYALVEFLALHRGELVSRTMLYDHLFDENDDSLSNLLEVHISNIRKKLGKDFVATRRGQGYIVGAPDDQPNDATEDDDV